MSRWRNVAELEDSQLYSLLKHRNIQSQIPVTDVSIAMEDDEGEVLLMFCSLCE